MGGEGGAMRVEQALGHRVRDFCDGAVLGTAAFVNAVFEHEQATRKRFGEKRSPGARRMRGAAWGELRVPVAYTHPTLPTSLRVLFLLCPGTLHKQRVDTLNAV